MNRVRADLLIDSALFKRVTEYAHRAGLTPDEVFAQSAEALLLHIDCFTPSELDHLRMQAQCAALGYTDYRAFPSGRDACIARFAFTVAILADMLPEGYGERWCYANITQARAALAEWDGADDTEPQGWHRHPATGRRRPDGDASREHIAF